MPAQNTALQYGAVARLFHWLTALGIFFLIASGLIAEEWPYGTESELATKVTLFSTHKTIGVLIFFIALARILWALTQPRPTPLHPERKLETLAAETVHWLLYGSILLVPLSGWVYHAATSGFAPIWWPFGQSLPFVPKSESLAHVASTLHEVLNWVLWASVALHVAGAMKHQVVDKDPTLSRMTKGVPAGATEAPKTSHAFSATLALGVWAVMLSAGTAMGMFEEREPRPTDGTELAEVDSQWTVQDGTLAITIQQMGSVVEGTFEQWTADIAFEEQDAPGKTGEVTVEIATGSIALGSVTSQAVGSDFLAVETFPTAVFQADILNVADGYAAEGTLTLKGVTMPVTMPFQMTIQDGIATMEGRTTLERLNYGVGENMADGTQLGLRVDVSVKLVAEKAD